MIEASVTFRSVGLQTPSLCSQNSMNVGVMRIAGHYYPSTKQSLPIANLAQKNNWLISTNTFSENDFRQQTSI